ncbi:Uncharacterised protein [Mycobacteroides abscessus subsp. abscessus]|nr:Uncharacterised protein [Mycobacteroides abscessus subsp. abscessus]
MNVIRIASRVLTPSSRKPSTSQPRQLRLCGPKLYRGMAKVSSTHGCC